jgi:hypothetical protein
MADAAMPSSAIVRMAPTMTNIRIQRFLQSEIRRGNLNHGHENNDEGMTKHE